MYLAVSLRGQAQGVLGNLSEQSNNFKALSTALQERFAPPNQTELYRCQLRDRRQKASESLAELAQDIRRLTNLAYPSAPHEVKETLSKEQFVDSLHSSDMRLKIKQARPMNLNDAVHHAIELEAYYRAEQKRVTDKGILYSTTQPGSGSDEIKDLKETMLTMQNEFKALTKKFEESIQHQNRRYDNNTYQNYRTERPRQRYYYDNTRPDVRKRTCFECGSESHFIQDCPKLNQQQHQPESNKTTQPQGGRQKHKKQSQSGNSDRKPDPNKKQDGGKISTSGSRGAGLFVSGTMKGVEVDCLVDTGATLTLISTKVWNTLCDDTLPLDKFEQDLQSASGELINIKGRTQVELVINGSKYKLDIVVADVDADVILGLDFLMKEGGKLDLGTSTLSIRGQTLKLSCYGTIGCYRVVVSERTEIPARSEMIIKGSILTKNFNDKDLCLIEPMDTMFQTGGTIVAKSLVKTKQEIPLRVINPTHEKQMLYPGTRIATASPVCEVQTTKFKTQSQPKHDSVPPHLKDLYERTIVGLNPKQSKEVSVLLTKYANIFSEGENDIGRNGIIKHKIDTGTAHPIKQPMRRVPMHMNSEVDSQIDQMIKKDVIQPSKSPWSSGIVLVKKKDGSTRFCIDYRRLNDVTIKDAYPLPRIDDCLDQLAGNQWFACLDMNSGYWQVEVDESDREKTAFTSRKGLYEFKVMPFGLCNAPATFERLMESVLQGLQWEICLIYLDDVIVTGKTFEEMVENLSNIFDRFNGANLKLKPKKCQLFAREVEFLGHIVSADGVQTDPKKTDAIKTWPRPECVRDVRSFLGLCSYYRRFIHQFAEIAKPLHKLTEKGRSFTWTDTCTKAFETLKQKLTESPILTHPDFSQPFILDTDASDVAIAAVLSQKIDGIEHAIAFASRTLSKSEKKYCVTRKELLALVHFVKYFKHYLYGKQFLLRTDHGSLRWLLNFKNPEGQVARWIEVLAPFDMKIEHRPGRLHGNADALSRRVCKQCGRDCVVQENQPSTAHARHLHQSGTEDKSDQNVEDLQTGQTNDQEVELVKEWVQQGNRPDSKQVLEGSYFSKVIMGTVRQIGHPRPATCAKMGCSWD